MSSKGDVKEKLAAYLRELHLEVLFTLLARLASRSRVR